MIREVYRGSPSGCIPHPSLKARPMTYALPVLVVACLCLGCVPASTPTPLPPDTHPSTDTLDAQAPDTNPNPQAPDTSPPPSPPPPPQKTPPIPPLADALRHSATSTLIHGPPARLAADL